MQLIYFGQRGLVFDKLNINPKIHRLFKVSQVSSITKSSSTHLALTPNNLYESNEYSLPFISVLSRESWFMQIDYFLQKLEIYPNNS